MRKAVSLFTGAGGIDLGMEAAGFETAAAIEFDTDAVKTLKANREHAIFGKDIHEVTSEELLNAAELKEGELDLLHGGPPCQPFSKAGYWANGDSKRLQDPRATTLEAYLRVLRDLKPKAFLLENVAGLAYKNKDEGIELLRNTIKSINEEYDTNYSFNVALLNAADYGVPQERERVFIIGSRDGRAFDFPKPTHKRLDRGGGHEVVVPKAEQLVLGSLEPALTAWDAIGDLEDNNDKELKMGGKWADLLPSIPEGCNYLYHTEKGQGLALFGWRRRYWSFLLKLSKQYPSWTIQAQPGSAIGPFHWKNRWLSAQELCRLQTFPDGYEIVGSRRVAQKQLGNAVPSALAEVLGLAIRRQFFDDDTAPTKPSLIPSRSSAIPSAEPLKAVPKKYLHLEGDHSAHPGTGKGNKAVQAER